MITKFACAAYRATTRTALPALFAACIATSGHGATYDFSELFKSEALPRSDIWVPPADESLPAEVSTLILTATKAFYENDFLTAERLARQITTAAPELGEGWYIIGLSLANLNRFEGAIEALDKAADQFKNNGQPLVVKGDILSSLSRIDEARAAYLAAIEIDPRLWHAHYQMGRIAESEGKSGEAAQHYLAAARNGATEQLNIRMDAARLALKSDQIEDAILAMAELAKAQPSNLKALAGLGHVLLRANRPSDASNIFKELEKADPKEPSAAILRARALIAAGDVQAAERALDDATSRIRKAPELYSELGRTRGALRDYDGALAAYERGLDLSPSAPDLIKGASLALFRTGQLDAALEQALQLTKLRPENAGDHLWLATVQEARTETAAAIASYERAITLDPDNWVAKNNLAVLLTEDTPERAVDLAREALERSGGSAQVKDTLGWAKFNSGDLDGALEIFEALEAEKPDDGKTVFRLGLIHARRGDTEAARTLLQKAAELDTQLSDKVQNALNNL